MLSPQILGLRKRYGPKFSPLCISIQKRKETPHTKTLPSSDMVSFSSPLARIISLWAAPLGIMG